jgi:hypothetical protein
VVGGRNGAARRAQPRQVLPNPPVAHSRFCPSHWPGFRCGI